MSCILLMYVSFLGENNFKIPRMIQSRKRSECREEKTDEMMESDGSGLKSAFCHLISFQLASYYTLLISSMYTTSINIQCNNIL